ncbi:hypothetical protein [Effusibacillus consociatus]|uniref:Uncharacterized protein n=1 Tax=Effusibacillus consociatus TaxID=1117041 RepID=A0ABV9Q4X6_9BACL
MNEITVFVEETAVTLPIHTQVAHAIRAYLMRRDPDLLKLVECRQIYAVDSTGHEVQQDRALVEGMRLYIRKLQK